MFGMLKAAAPPFAAAFELWLFVFAVAFGATAPKGQGQFMNSCNCGHGFPTPALWVSTARVRFLEQLALDGWPDLAGTTACGVVAATGIHLPQEPKSATLQSALQSVTRQFFD